MPSQSAPSDSAYSTIIGRLPLELFKHVIHHLDTHSMRSLLRALPSFSSLVTVVLDPAHRGNGKPLFFTGFPAKVVYCRAISELPNVSSFVKLYEINPRGKKIQQFINRDLKQLKAMSFIHFTGEISVMGDTTIHKTLNSMHPYAPRTSFEYRHPRKFQKKIIEGTSSSGSTPSDHNTKDTPLSVTYNSVSEAEKNCSCNPNISIDSLSSHIIENVSWSTLERLEVMFYKSDSLPVVQNLDLPLLLSFRVKYYQKFPLIMKAKLAYASEGYKVFEMIDTSVFDVQYGSDREHTPKLIDYLDVIDLSFTKDFDSIVFVGGTELHTLKFCDFSKATSLFWYDNWRGELDIEEASVAQKDDYTNFREQPTLVLPHIKNLTYITSLEYGFIPKCVTLPELRVVRIYSNNSYLIVDHIITKKVDPESFFNASDDYARLRIVDICCDLPRDSIGSDEHCVIGRLAMYMIIWSRDLRCLRLRGCYIGDDNAHLYRPGCEDLFGGFRDEPGIERSMTLELVRMMDPEVDQMSSLRLTILKTFITYLTSLTITQVVGGKDFIPWSGLTVSFADGVLTDGLVMEIDSSFGHPEITYEEDGIVHEMTVAKQDAPLCEYIDTSASDYSRKQWIAIKPKSDEEPWSMALGNSVEHSS